MHLREQRLEPRQERGLRCRHDGVVRLEDGVEDRVGRDVDRELRLIDVVERLGIAARRQPRRHDEAVLRQHRLLGRRQDIAIADELRELRRRRSVPRRLRSRRLALAVRRYDRPSRALEVLAHRLADVARIAPLSLAPRSGERDSEAGPRAPGISGSGRRWRGYGLRGRPRRLLGAERLARGRTTHDHEGNHEGTAEKTRAAARHRPLHRATAQHRDALSQEKVTTSPGVPEDRACSRASRQAARGERERR